MKRIVFNLVKIALMLLFLNLCSCVSADDGRDVVDNEAKVEAKQSEKQGDEDEFVLSLATKEAMDTYISLFYRKDEPIFAGLLTTEIKEFKIKGTVILEIIEVEKLRLWKNGKEALIPENLRGVQRIGVNL